jgi:hypothetical protein
MKMSNKNDLYTDYALQMFSSYISDDLSSMEYILESFKKDGKNIDEMFMPGLIYGLMYHLGQIFRLVSVGTDVPLEKLLSDYAMDYAVAREHLMDNPLLNVHRAREVLEQILSTVKELEELYNEDDDF